ncbi:MAG: hypothetical protein Q8R47_01500 [Nanoarchaeota archaeon]|nr:hypothetical protein [Nanoarchaeota archaeon]
MSDDNMNDEDMSVDDKLRKSLEGYKALVQKYIPDSDEDRYLLRSTNIPSRFLAVYLEVVVDLDGNEDDFKRCLDLAKAPKTNLHNYEGIDDCLAKMKAYARMIKNSK